MAIARPGSLPNERDSTGRVLPETGSWRPAILPLHATVAHLGGGPSIQLGHVLLLRGGEPCISTIRRHCESAGPALALSPQLRAVLTVRRARRRARSASRPSETSATEIDWTTEDYRIRVDAQLARLPRCAASAVGCVVAIASNDEALARHLPDVAVLVVLVVQLPIALTLGLRGTVEPWFLVPGLWAAMPVDALLGVLYAVNLVKAVRRRLSPVERRLQTAGLTLCVVDVLAISWVFRDSHW